MPLLPLPRPQPRLRKLSPQVNEWLDAAERTPDEVEAFWEAAGHLAEGRWGPVNLSASFVWPGIFHARMKTGQYILVRTGMLPPLPAIWLLYVGTGDELGNWKPPPEREPHWKRTPPPRP